MPIRNAAQVRAWLIPWAIAPFAVAALLLGITTPPLYAWAPTIITALGTFILAGVLTGILWSFAVSALKLELGSARSLAVAALIGAVVPALPLGLRFGTMELSYVVFAALGAISARRMRPSVRAPNRAPSATRTP